MVAAGERPLGSREVARLLKMDYTRVNRILKSLAAMDLVQQDARRKYLPGPGLHVLAAFSLRGSGLLRWAFDEIEYLHKQFDGVVALGVLWRLSVCYLYHGDRRQPIGVSISGNRLYPAWDSSLGIVLASQYEPNLFNELVQEAVRLGQLSSSESEQSFRRQVEEARRSGVGIHPRGTSIAVPVPGIARVALGLAGKDVWMEDHREEVLMELKGAALRLGEHYQRSQKQG